MHNKYSQFKTKRDTILINFVKNENNQQEKFLLVYLIFQAMFILFLCSVEAILIVWGLQLGSIFIIFLVRKVLSNKSPISAEKRNRNFFLYSTIICLYSLYFEKYFVGFILISCSYFFLFKNDYLEREKNNKNPSPIIRCLQNIEIRNYHLNKEFTLYRDFINVTSFVWIFISIAYFYGRFLDMDYLLFAEVLEALIFTAVTNNILTVAVYHNITYYCNPKISPELLSKIADLAPLAPAILGGLTGFHYLSTNNPLPYAPFFFWQKHIAQLPFIAGSAADIQYANNFVEVTGLNTIPTTEEGFINKPVAEMLKLQKAENPVQFFMDHHLIIPEPKPSFVWEKNGDGDYVFTQEKLPVLTSEEHYENFKRSLIVKK